MLKPDQAWTEWLRGRGIHPRQAWESIKIYEHFGDEAAAATCRITQALIRAGAIKKKQERPRVHQPLAIAEGQGSTAFDDDDPPPAEDPDSVRLALVRIANRLAQIVEKLADIPRGEIPAEFVERSITYLIQMRDHIHGPAPQRG